MSYDRWNARMCNIPEALLAFGIKAEIRKAKPYVKLNKADIANNLALRKSQEKCTRLCFGIGGPVIEYSSRVKINI